MSDELQERSARREGTSDPVPLRLSRQPRYTRVAITLHWAIAALIIFNLSIGFFMEGWKAPYRTIAVGLHVSAGITVLALTVLRVVWRLLHEPPPYPAGVRSWERHAAHFVHFLLYAGMVLMPLLGWAIVSAHPSPGSPGFPVWAAQHPKLAPPPPPKNATAAPAAPPRSAGLKVWGLVPLPLIEPIERIGEQPGGVEPQWELHEQFVAWHGLGGYLMIALFLLHLAGALKHQFVDRQAELARMGVGRRREEE